MATNLTWRVYRDAGRAPVPVLQRKQHAHAIQFLPEAAHTGNTAVVQSYMRAWGLFSGTEINTPGNTLPAQMLRDEPVLLEVRFPVAGRTIRFAQPSAFQGTGPNPYQDPRIIVVDSEPRLFIPGEVIDTGATGNRVLAARSVGKKCYQIPAGFAHVLHITVSGQPYQGNFDYFYYHGVLYLEDAVEGALVQATVRERYTLFKPLPEVTRDLSPVYDRGTLLGYVTRAAEGTYTDVRRLPARAHGARVDSMYFDGDPVSTGHLFVLETAADPDRLAAAVERALPGGTLYRQTADYERDKVTLVLPETGGATGNPTLFEWADFETGIFYHLQVARDAAFTKLEVNEAGLTDTSFSTGTLTPSTTLYWRVRAYDHLGATDWSDTRTLTATGTTAPSTEILTTSDGKVFKTASGEVFMVRG